MIDYRRELSGSFSPVYVLTRDRETVGVSTSLQQARAFVARELRREWLARSCAGLPLFKSNA